MSEPIKIGPFWNRATFDPGARVVKRRGRTVCAYDEVKSLKVREIINSYEEEQLLDANPSVQKRPREAELWVETKDGQTLLVATLDQAGLLLEAATNAARQIGVPVRSERTHIVEKAPRAA